MLTLLVHGVGMGAGQAAVLVEVPDVVGETQAAGTTTLETALFVVSVATAYSPTIAAGLIISQAPIGGSFAAEGSTVTITVSLGAEPRSEGGSAKPKHRKRYYVEIDGQYFEVDSQAEAEERLKQALTLAQEVVAPQAVERSVKRIRRGKTAAVPATPVLKSSPEIAGAVDEYRERIEAAYRQIAVDAELRELLRLKLLDEDDEETITALLLH
jgi:hypothetical protein